MRARSSGKIAKALLKKGFLKNKKGHHQYYCLEVAGVQTDIYTYLSHGKNGNDYGNYLMQQIKQQLRFEDTNLAERFLDCPMTKVEYIQMLSDLGEI